MLRLKSVKWEGESLAQSCSLKRRKFDFVANSATSPKPHKLFLSGTLIHCLWNNNTYINGCNFKGKEYWDVLYKTKHSTASSGRVLMKIISFFASTTPFWILSLIIKPVWKFKYFCFHYSFACDLTVLDTYVILHWKWREVEVLCLFMSCVLIQIDYCKIETVLVPFC